jgi:exopolyphosphatase/guanosine-5'-triphosphate,3'-diphosphate pyrophosphatase
MDAAETAAHAEIEAIAHAFGPRHWREAFGSSGTALALADILEQNQFSAGGITAAGLGRLRRRMLAAGHVSRLKLVALKGERAPVLAAGLAIMTAAMEALSVRRLAPVGGALRLGVLYDLLGRTTNEDVRTETVERFVGRYGVDRTHAARVGKLAHALYLRATDPPDPALARLVTWAGMLHEAGMSISHASFHKHGAYILQNADMPGFAAGDQARLAFLVYGCRGGLAKIEGMLSDKDVRAAVLALRLAVLVHHARAEIAVPRIRLAVGKRIRFAIGTRWLAARPLSAYLLAKERAQWEALGYAWRAWGR